MILQRGRSNCASRSKRLRTALPRPVHSKCKRRSKRAHTSHGHGKRFGASSSFQTHKTFGTLNLNDFPFFNENQQNVPNTSTKKMYSVEELLELIEITHVNHTVKQNALQVDTGLNPEKLTFSEHLNKALVEEEGLRKAGKLYRHFSDKVDSMLRNNLRRYYKNVLQAKERKWTSLERKQRDNWRRIQRLVEKYLGRKIEMNKRLNMEDILSKSAREDGSFEAQAFKVEEDCRARYFKMEQFNLKVAMEKQLQRLDADWDDHIAMLQLEYEAMRVKINGMDDNINTTPMLAKCTANPVKLSPYKTKEKQDQLIHTAPVLRPTKRKPLVIEKHTVQTKDVEKKTQLNRLNLKFQEALKDIKRQKQNAAQMIKRRNMQINLQLETEVLVQDKIRRIMRREKRAFKTLLDAVTNSNDVQSQSENSISQ